MKLLRLITNQHCLVIVLYCTANIVTNTKTIPPLPSNVSAGCAEQPHQRQQKDQLPQHTLSKMKLNTPHAQKNLLPHYQLP